MNKIPTIFERDWEGKRGVMNEPSGTDVHFTDGDKFATEKIDGTNVRVTVRNHTAVRLEKRRNPDKIQKHKGISEPWYVDAYEAEPADKWIFDALKNSDLSDISDGEWSGEAVGLSIQGNPLSLDKNIIIFFSLGQCPVFEDAPTGFEELREWLPKQKSKIGKDCGIEGIVWWDNKQAIGKIKLKDFK